MHAIVLGRVGVHHVCEEERSERSFTFLEKGVCFENEGWTCCVDQLDRARGLMQRLNLRFRVRVRTRSLRDPRRACQGRGRCLCGATGMLRWPCNGVMRTVRTRCGACAAVWLRRWPIDLSAV